MRSGKLLASGIATLFLLSGLAMPVVAYTYNGARWSYSQADWRFSTDFPDEYETAVSNAANTWSNAGSVFSFDYDWWETVNKVDWEDLGSSGPIASTTWTYTGTPSYSCLTGASLTGAVTNFNNQKSFTTSPGSSYPPYDVETVALHEFGHWLSLGHSYSGTVMYAYYEGTKRSLTQDDKNGIICIYG